ncbi:MAG: Cell division initiation protein DivIVA [Oscillospiraceae bacterium]|nr:Cell division initiation protein DivIVA [Oscillospiraceae bacterium]
MLTPQEVSSHAFSKASFGGYNMAMVDEFLDQLTADYTALFKENALLKGKMKSLTDTIEEYRSTEMAMRKALLAAQQMADDIVKEAEARRDSILTQTDELAQSREAELKKLLQAEEEKLSAARENTWDYVLRIQALFSDGKTFVDSLSELNPFTQTAEASLDDTAAEDSAEPQAAAEPAATHFPGFSFERNEDAQSISAADAAAKLFPQEGDLTRQLDRFSDLRFGKDFEIE